jgi:hypothetical protein
MLFINDESVNTTNFRDTLNLKSMKVNPCDEFSFYYSNLLFNFLISLLMDSVICIAEERLKAASG